MQIFSATEVHQRLNFPLLIANLKLAFANSADLPRRQVYPLEPGKADAFAVLPAWDDQGIAVKAFTYMPDNPKKDPALASLYSQILLFDRHTGQPQALIDGTSVTYWRTAAVSALAADFLARQDAKRLLLLGTGNLAPFMALAHASVRPLTEIRIWGRRPEAVAEVIRNVARERPDLHLSPVGDLAEEVPQADIISCATGAHGPLFNGEWVSPGSHCDLVGNHHRDGRECDSQLVLNSSVYVDSRTNVLHEAGELLIPMAEGLINESHVLGELADLCRGTSIGRKNPQERTLFKSVGSALADLAAARTVFNGTGN
ncbi:bifunctional Delta(1)-pyrroline-2-carboxylate/Delta(1)-piperideine-2-carboxylate reductase [Shewanella sedimentimangrovi]|uniref:Ornithine cyclodeaminase family protein n=1 Tax=Shewanella sedimentimangrovi TaxID=2814293 RepID=A0ABX7R0F1_9GAMM|nr:ornithine cyclodeaminase family protein [Shewanella sedimentimangrovi]QSX36350.1 ornithine cyclodeaminase family protein [Shewanella sedimentimangrovi]